MVKHKKLSKARGITVPKDLAANAGFFAGAAVDLIEIDGGILMCNHVPTCTICGSVNSVETILGKEVCAECAAKIAKEIGEKYAG